MEIGGLSKRRRQSWLAQSQRFCAVARGRRAAMLFAAALALLYLLVVEITP